MAIVEIVFVGSWDKMIYKGATLTPVVYFCGVINVDATNILIAKAREDGLPCLRASRVDVKWSINEQVCCSFLVTIISYVVTCVSP